MKDRIFDGWADRFNQRIYADDNPKGLIRTTVLQRDLTTQILDKDDRKLSVLDIGGGFGQMSLWLASLGHHVVFSEPSRDMRSIAQDNFQEAKLNTMPEVLGCTLQELSASVAKRFDLILFHAVLEWLAEPEQALALIKPLMHSDSRLSLMFYNKHSAALRSLVVGDFQRALSDNLAGDGVKRLAPISPLDPYQVEIWVKQQHLEIQHWSGMRSFFDYMLPQVRSQADRDEVLAGELLLSTQRPWRDIARYQHMICRFKTS